MSEFVFTGFFALLLLSGHSHQGVRDLLQDNFIFRTVMLKSSMVIFLRSTT